MAFHWRERLVVGSVSYRGVLIRERAECKNAAPVVEIIREPPSSSVTASVIAYTFVLLRDIKIEPNNIVR